MKEFTLMYLVNLALRRIWTLILSAVVFAAGAFCYCNFLASPQYTATASVLVTNGGSITSNNNGVGSVATTDISASIYLVETVVDILNTSDIFKLLADEPGVDYTYTELKKMATVSSREDNSMFVDIKFKAGSEKEAAELVNKLVVLAPEYITKFIPNSNVAVASSADKGVMVYPKTLYTVIIAGFLGAVLAFVVVLIMDSLDQAISSEEDFTQNYTIPLIGVVPDFESLGVMGNTNHQKGGR